MHATFWQIFLDKDKNKINRQSKLVKTEGDAAREINSYNGGRPMKHNL